MVAPQEVSKNSEKKTPSITTKMVTRGYLQKKEIRRLTLGLRAVTVARNTQKTNIMLRL